MQLLMFDLQEREPQKPKYRVIRTRGPRKSYEQVEMFGKEKEEKKIDRGPFAGISLKVLEELF